MQYQDLTAKRLSFLELIQLHLKNNYYLLK